MPPQADDLTVLNNDNARQFEVQAEGSTAILTYQRLGRSLVLSHVEVPRALEGRGIASQLTRTALEFARMEHVEVVPVCPYVAQYLKKHPEYHDLLSDKNLKRLHVEPEK